MKELDQEQQQAAQEAYDNLFGSENSPASKSAAGSKSLTSKARPSFIGGNTIYTAPFPTPSLPQNTSGSDLAARQEELNVAATNNYFNFSALPGGIGVHGNMQSPDVNLNSPWRIRVSGIPEGTVINDPSKLTIPAGREDDFGVDDADPGEDSIDIAEPLIRYIEKNWWALLTSYSNIPDAIQKLTQVVQDLLKIIVDSNGNPNNIKAEIIDPILLLLPVVKPKTRELADYFPRQVAADYRHYIKPDWAGDFRNDDVMGWLQVAPSTPIYDHLQPYTQHQSNFPINDVLFRKAKGFENDSLDRAMREKRLFIADYKAVEGNIKKRPTGTGYDYGANLYMPIALFAVPRGSDKNLKIIAIQPTQDASSQIMTPADDYWSWQKAKNVVTTISSFSAVIDHLGTHVFLGRIPVGFYRHIPQQHPLRSIIEPHLMSLVTNNYSGIFAEVQTGAATDPFATPYNGLLTGIFDKAAGISSLGFVNETLRRASDLDFITHSTPISKKERRKGPYKKIVDHPLYDDDINMPVIQRWVKGYINLYYKSDSDVSNDTELQAFLSYTANEGAVKSFPSSAYSKAELIDVVSRIIYWTSVNHSLDRLSSFVELGSLGYFGSLPTPTPAWENTIHDWFAVLPPVNVGLANFSFSRIFVDLPKKWHRSLGKYPTGHFQHDPRVYRHLKRFQNQIKKVDQKLINKNKQRRWGYEVHMPSYLTMSPWN